MGPSEHKRCLGCGYILDGLPEPRCPECGRGFDPDDPKTYFTSLRSGRRYVWLAIAGWMVGGAALVALDSGAGWSSRWVLAGLFVVAAVGFAVEVKVFDVTWAALNSPPGTLRSRRAFVVARAISVFVILAVLFYVLQLLVAPSGVREQK